MSHRSSRVLGRWPAHLEAAGPDKRLSRVAETLAEPLDLLSAELADVRRAHRLPHAGTRRDLIQLGALLGLEGAGLALLDLRAARTDQRLAELEAAPEGDPEARDRAAQALFALWGTAAPGPELGSYAAPRPTGTEPDLESATGRLLGDVRVSLGSTALLEAVRTRLIELARIRSQLGNGTVRCLLAAAANALDLDLGEIVYSPDRFRHAAAVRDRLRLRRPVFDGQGRPSGETGFEPGVEVLGLEENPLRREETEPSGRAHGERFSVIRRGFDSVRLEIRVQGLAIAGQDATVAPMVVQRDAGHGLGYTGTVPAGAVLVFTQEGRALLDGQDVTERAYAWQGACFAQGRGDPRSDFVFAGLEDPLPAREARFATVSPADALDPDAAFPHAGGSLPVPPLEVGETRLAFFVQAAHFAAAPNKGEAVSEPLALRPFLGYAGGSVLGAGAEAPPPAGTVSLAWLEHEAYAVRLLLPERFRTLEGDGPGPAELVLAALQSFRPAGVELRAEWCPQEWVLGEGALPAPAAGADLLSALEPGTVLGST